MDELLQYRGPAARLPEVPDDEVAAAIRAVPAHFAAGYFVDLNAEADAYGSLSVLSGANTAVGTIVDLLGANSYCNVFVAGVGSGPLPIFIQTSDTTASGDFTDPTSGLPAGAFPVNVVSGGIFWANSGIPGSGIGTPMARASGVPPLGSGGPGNAGGIVFAAFQRPQRYARLLCTSGNASIAGVNFTAGFMSQKKTTGASGTAGGFTYSPTSGTVNV